MRVLELISRWTEEEKKQHADLIMECLNREQLLVGLKGRIEESEKEMSKSLDLLLSGLRNLAQTVNGTAEQIQDTYLRLAKVKGNA